LSALPAGWRWSRLADIATITLGQSPPGNSYNRRCEGVPFFQGKSEFGETIAEVRQYTTAGTKLANAGDILLSVRAPVGPTNLAPCDCAIGRGLAALRGDDQVDQRYLLWAIRATAGQLVQQAKGSTFEAVTGAQLREHEVPVAPRDQQRRIVELLEDHLSRLDAAHELLKASRRRTAALELAVIDQVFAAQARAADWPILTLEECARDEPRAITDGPFGSNLTSAHYTDHGARVVRLQNIGDGVFKPADAFISLEHYEALTAHDVRQGDLVIASLGDRLPRAAVVPDLHGPAIVKADCIRVRIRDDVEPEWLALACRATPTKRWAQQRLHGMGRQRLGLAGIRRIPIPVPEATVRREQLDRINRTLDGAARLNKSIRFALERLEAVRRATLEAAFSGRLAGPSGDGDPVAAMAGGR
jgi:type I restriction enzyme S subunit